jgi:type VI protein secretion system component Hcp
MPTKTTKKLNKRAKHLKKGKKLEATRPLTDVASPKLYNLSSAGTHFQKVELA